MKKTIYLHVGFPKTGTTSIQYFCSSHKEELLKENILYPDAGRKKHKYVHFSSRENFEKEFNNLNKEIKINNVNSIILSNEDLIKRPLKELIFLRKKFNGYNVKILIYYRQIESWLLSMYKYHIKLGCAYRSFRNFIKKYDFWLNLKKIINKWVSVFKDKNIKLRSFESANRGVVYDFLKYIGVQNKNLLEKSCSLEKKNKSLNDGTLVFILLLNRIKFSLPYIFGLDGLELAEVLNKPNKKIKNKERIIKSW
ncbi:MAG: sulfotransferase domain-containing protein, partial [archaeon]